MNNDAQNTRIKTENWATQTQIKLKLNSGALKECYSCPTSGSVVLLLLTLGWEVKKEERRIGFVTTKNRSDAWSSGIKILVFCTGINLHRARVLGTYYIRFLSQPVFAELYIAGHLIVITRVTRRVLLVEQELFVIHFHSISSTFS